MVRSQALTWLFAGIATASSLLMTAVVGFRIEPTSFLLWTGVISLLIGVHVFYAVTKRSSALTHLLGTTAATCWSLSMTGMLALAGLGTGAPLIDGSLIAVDRAFCLDARATVAWLSQWEIAITVLAVATRARFLSSSSRC